MVVEEVVAIGILPYEGNEFPNIISGDIVFGMPIPKDKSKRGNLRTKFNVKFPTRLTPDKIAGIKKLLGS